MPGYIVNNFFGTSEHTLSLWILLFLFLSWFFSHIELFFCFVFIWSSMSRGGGADQCKRALVGTDGIMAKRKLCK